MGLALNYRLRARKDVGTADIPRLVAAMRDWAIAKMKTGLRSEVSNISSDDENLVWHSEWLQVCAPDAENTFRGIEVPATEGYVFAINLGKDCEPLQLGLCHYPEQVTDSNTSISRTVSERGWRFSCSCKTQYSSLHGWENFNRVHVAAVELLVGLRELGVEVEIDDEGGYWPGRNVDELHRRIDRMNGLTAAMAGAIKDASGDDDTLPLQAPILAHPDFEHLEARAIEREKDAITQAVKLVNRQLPPDHNVT